MPTVQIAAWWVAITLIAIGLSHALRPREWTGLFTDLLPKPYAGLWIGLLTLMPGLLILLAHNIWVPRPAVIVTVLGWGWTIKGTLYLLWPSLPQRIAMRHMRHPERFRWAGLVMAALGATVILDRIGTFGS
jgi:uncharacterized protein YjeT (DUF2065 family)